MIGPTAYPMWLGDGAPECEVFTRVAMIGAYAMEHGDDGFVRAELRGVFEDPLSSTLMRDWLASSSDRNVRLQCPDGLIMCAPWRVMDIRRPIPGASLPFIAFLKTDAEIVLVEPT